MSDMEKLTAIMEQMTAILKELKNSIQPNCNSCSKVLEKEIEILEMKNKKLEDELLEAKKSAWHYSMRCQTLESALVEEQITPKVRKNQKG